ncbi:MAG: NAD-dependent protein deacylase [Candidatus Omnitrophica bacterium]|nr:NAD-dependent protein deacylase [Candidatus Omnitrophota bacterium]
MVNEEGKIKKVAQLLKRSKSIFFITGAGVSADSGLPTYRGVGGLYNGKTTVDGIPIEMALAGEMLRNKPEVTWKYLAQIEENCRNATYNRAHEVIAEMERNFERVWVLTQNIDGFHHAAGSKNIIDIHGDTHHLICVSCGWRSAVKDYAGLKIPPLCPRCSHIVRPEVVFFGEELPYEKLRILYEQLNQGFDIYFSVGTTSVFPYIQEPIIQAKNQNKPTVEINPDKTLISDFVDIKLSMTAAAALDALWREYKTV